MNIAQIENNLQLLIQSFNKDSFIYDLLLAYGQPKASITRLQKGGLNLSKIPGEIAWKKKLFFKEVNGEDLHDLIDTIATHEKSIKHDPRFIIVTDYETLLAVDRKTTDTLDIPILDISKHFDFFLPWAGMEKAQHQGENPADVKAAEKMAKLYDEIRKDNPAHTPAEVHNLNVFLSRLLFCFFAEDTGIFPQLGQFTNAIDSHTQLDGSDLHTYLDDLFEVMNTDTENRNNLPAFLEAFPYVNGGLYRNRHTAPIFSRKSRQALIECGKLQWKDIHPDIFGSMIQAVVKPEDRGGFGMHYTSVPNIMKVIEPLFLNELYEEFNAAKHDPRRLHKLLERISKIKIFDPACGSGNFLIIAYKELRLLEIKILQQLQNLQQAATGFEPKQMELIPKAQLTLAASYQQSMFSRIELSQFYGIEIDDFAHEIAILSLWLAQHQMNMKFKEVFGTANPTLPLQAGGNIVHGNATRIDWKRVCPIEDGNEIYILGNPPFLGSRNQDSMQKEDMKATFKTEYKSLDYVSCWLLKGSNYIVNINAQFAFVSTNSICQGEQVALIWPKVLNENLEIGFAHQSFTWENSAKDNAAVIVVIVGVRNKNTKIKKLFKEDRYLVTTKISPYLTSGYFVYITRRSEPISSIPPIVYGSMPNDGGNLLMSTDEKEKLIKQFPTIAPYIKHFIGAKDFLNGGERWCLYISNNELNTALQFPNIAERLKKVTNVRELSTEKSTRALAHEPNRFYFSAHKNTDSIIIPRHSSERRDYIPIGFLSPKTIIADSALGIYDAKLWHFAIIESRIHMTWIRAVCGRIKSDYRYSTAICYNTFPIPLISDTQKKELENFVYQVLAAREKHSEKTLAQMYDPDDMPEELRQAHQQLDLAVERCYRSKPFESDEERLEYLFKLYEQMITEEKQRSGELIFEQPKLKKKRK